MIEPTRETDARVAEAMGWAVVQFDTATTRQPGLCRRNPSEAGSPFEYMNVEELHYLPQYTTDPALVVPMMERIYSLTGTVARLDRSREGWVAVTWAALTNDDARLWEGPTANLALATVLLAVWERVNEAAS